MVCFGGQDLFLALMLALGLGFMFGIEKFEF